MTCTQNGLLNTVADMTLRDWFAGQALEAIVARAALNQCGDFVAGDCLLQHYKAPKYAAKTAYAFADAMLAARTGASMTFAPTGPKTRDSGNSGGGS